MKCFDGRSADFQVCRAAGVPTCGWSADLEIGDTAGWETCATNLHPSAGGMNSFAVQRLQYFLNRSIAMLTASFLTPRWTRILATLVIGPSKTRATWKAINSPANLVAMMEDLRSQPAAPFNHPWKQPTA